MKNKISRFIVVVLAIISMANGAIAQEAKKRILIVPYSRFDFQSSVSLSKIVEYNQWSTEEEVFEKYSQHLISKISEEHPNLALFQLDQQSAQYIHQRVPKEYKTKPVSRLGVDISQLIKSGKLMQMLDNYSADYMLFLTQYEITNKMISTKSSFEGSKFLSWSVHQLTYELYDQNGNLILIADQIQLAPKYPTEETAKTKGTLLSGMDEVYKVILEDISEKLKLYKGNRPIYKR